MCDGPRFTTEIPMQMEHVGTSDLAVNFPVHLAICLDRQISLEKLPFKLCNSDVCFLT